MDGGSGRVPIVELYGLFSVNKKKKSLRHEECNLRTPNVIIVNEQKLIHNRQPSRPYVHVRDAGLIVMYCYATLVRFVLIV